MTRRVHSKPQIDPFKLHAKTSQQMTSRPGRSPARCVRSMLGDETGDSKALIEQALIDLTVR